VTAPDRFARVDRELGVFALRPVAPASDAAMLRAWVTHPKSVYWMMQDATVDDVLAEHEGIAASPHHWAYVGTHRAAPCFLAEVYDPAQSELAGVYEPAAGDVGMHVLAAPTERPLPGFTRAVFRTVMELVFDGFGATRVVVEPDAANTAIHRLNAWAGFRAERTVRLDAKEALLSWCTRDDYDRSAAARGDDR
jgi:hypothetical protein